MGDCSRLDVLYLEFEMIAKKLLEREAFTCATGIRTDGSPEQGVNDPEDTRTNGSFIWPESKCPSPTLTEWAFWVKKRLFTHGLAFLLALKLVVCTPLGYTKSTFPAGSKVPVNPLNTEGTSRNSATN